jgi:TPR repeat protein
VAEHAAQGQSNKQIADELRLSEHTIKNYLTRVFEKLGVSSRFELLFLLFNERNGPVISRAATIDTADLNHPIESYLKAAQEGLIAAQYLVGLAHLEGCGMEKNGCSAYYWLRIAEENSHELRQRTRALTEELKSKIRTEELETQEHSVHGPAAGRRYWGASTRPQIPIEKHSFHIHSYKAKLLKVPRRGVLGRF